MCFPPPPDNGEWFVPTLWVHWHREGEYSPRTKQSCSVQRRLHSHAYICKVMCQVVAATLSCARKGLSPQVTKITPNLSPAGTCTASSKWVQTEGPRIPPGSREASHISYRFLLPVRWAFSASFRSTIVSSISQQLGCVET